MKQFIKNISFLVLTALLITALLLSIVFFVVAPLDRGGYNASILDKMERLKSLESPKIILVGNSNVAFGINSQMLEERFGMEVVNLGLHGGLGNAFHENMAMQNIGKGDIVILMHNSYSAVSVAQPNLIWNAIGDHFELLPLIGHENLSAAIKALPSYFRSSIYHLFEDKGDVQDNCYYRVWFNTYGDNVFPRTERIYTFDSASVEVPQISDEQMERLDRINQYCQKQGAYLVIAGYPVADGPYTPDHSAFAEFWNELRDRAACPVISEIEDYFFPYSFFYDTNLHLTEAGAQERTSQLIADLEEWMPQRDEKLSDAGSGESQDAESVFKQ